MTDICQFTVTYSMAIIYIDNFVNNELNSNDL